MKRVGNDHEELHNAKLSPNGYYNGFHHKDFEGNFVQKKHSKKHHRGKRIHRNSMIQLKDHDKDTDDLPDENSYIQDHEKDTDDFLEDGTYVNYEHEDDTEDISELVDN